MAEQRLKIMEENIDTQYESRKEIWQRLADLEKATYNICWRLDKVEKEHESRRLE